jgi:uncharacterized membrane protein
MEPSSPAGGLRILGHPVHPLLAHFPIALWVSACFWDGLFLARGEPIWRGLAFWSLVAGSVASVPTLATGFLDYLRLPQAHPAERTASRHLQAMALAAACFFGSLLSRTSGGSVASRVGPWGLILSTLGLAAVLAGGFWGAELVYRHRVGIEIRPEE